MEGTREDRASGFSQDNPSFAKKRCIVKDANFEKLDKAVYTWFIQQRSKCAPVSGPLLQEKALQMFRILYPDKDADSFKGSSGWLHKFSCRHGVRGISLQGESLSADASAVFTFRSKLFRKMKRKGTLETKCLMRMRLDYCGDFCHQELSYTVEKVRLKFKKIKRASYLISLF